MNSRSGAHAGMVLVVAGIAALGGAALLHRQRTDADTGARQQASDTARLLEQRIGALKIELTSELEAAADIPQIRSALGNRADAVTFLDLFKNEDWWERYRNRACAILVGDEVVVTQLFDPEAAAEGARRARGTAGSSVQALEAHRQVHLMAVGAFRLPRSGIAFTLLLGRPLDRAQLEKLGAGATALAVSDGRRIQTLVGDGELAAAAGTLVGREGEGTFAPGGADWTAAAVPLADKAWLVALARRSGQGMPASVVLGCAGLGGVLLLAGLVAVGRGRRRVADPEPAAIAPATSVGAQRPSIETSAPRIGSASAFVSGTPHLMSGSSPRSMTAAPAARPTSAGVSGPFAGSAATAMAAEGGQQFGRYRLIERIGEGGMAEVFTAMLSGAEGFERVVVIKRLKPHLALNPDAVSQFIDEAKLGSVLTHSNIVTVSDFGKVGDGYYLAQEFVDGRTLAQIATRYREKYDRPVPAAVVYHVVHEVLGGIAYAHERQDAQGRPLGIVHRDVSPTNIMISFQGDVKLLDFGIVKATERVSKTREGNVKGNVGYMSPEQARGLEVTNRSDLFSLGLVMFELLSGDPFYLGGGAGEVLYQAATGPTVDHLARIAALPAPAPEILRRVLAMDVAGRYPSARHFAHDLTTSATMPKGQVAEMMRALYAAG